MFKNVFLILLFIHILGDFYFQSENLSKEKNSDFKGIVKHSSIYAISCFVFMIIIVDDWAKSVMPIMALIHLLVDSAKYLFIKKNKNFSIKSDNVIYAVDQMIHILTLIIISLIIARNNFSVNKIEIIDDILRIIEISPYQSFTWILAILFVGKPANVTIKKLLSPFKPSASELETSTPLSLQEYSKVEPESACTLCESKDIQGNMISDEIRAGAFIGFLERFIILILLAISQYSAIGLVLTAKSIARYDKIAKDQVFVEYIY
ncbi:uncharacterized protein DUF3307 [Alkalibaculum bacchi]|uniref:Uncharacterized protein DUF3307 n=1 Tax=Alkalibaculum bacchi TaxID=645887 RepID=A0A366IA81_9FIRM|nr:DUF3307 domain-containing protein [Alkalibaculum bacchi]RBP66786.1 uncharacterized protein DUF3307 [Alkalibaculum bacchi]